MQDEHIAQALDILKTVRLLQAHMGRRLHEARHTQHLCGELTMRQMNTLVVIRERGEANVKELAEALNVSPPSASTMVERLVELGMATREPGTEDRREVCVQLSEAGRAFTAELEEHFAGCVAELLLWIGPEMAGQWHAVYRRLREVISEEPEQAPPAPDASPDRTPPHQRKVREC